MMFQRDQPLNLVIMSATLRVEDFTENRYLFPIAPPVVKARAFSLSKFNTVFKKNFYQYAVIELFSIVV